METSLMRFTARDVMSAVNSWSRNTVSPSFSVSWNLFWAAARNALVEDASIEEQGCGDVTMFNADAELHVENDINCIAPVAAGDAVAGPVVEAAIQAMYVVRFPLLSDFHCLIAM